MIKDQKLPSNKIYVQTQITLNDYLIIKGKAVMAGKSIQSYLADLIQKHIEFIKEVDDGSKSIDVS